MLWRNCATRQARAFVVITGAGEIVAAPAWTSSNLSSSSKTIPPEKSTVSSSWPRNGVTRTLRYFPEPTITIVNGCCFGGAFSIVEGCDLAFAAKEEATFGLSEINFKHFPGGSVSKSLANILRPRDALFYAMTGRTFKGDRAAEIGFVNAAYPLSRSQQGGDGNSAGNRPEGSGCARRVQGRISLLAGDVRAMLRSTSLRPSPTSSRCGRRILWRSEGIGDFLQGKYRPGLGGHKAGG